MGCSSSCKIFEMLNSFIERISQNKLHIPNILHLLDDFIIISTSETLCQKQLDSFLMLCNYLGIPKAPSFFLFEKWSNSHQLNSYTDASGALGFSAIFCNHWCYGQWPRSGTLPNCFELRLFGVMQNQCILFLTGKELLVHVINKQSCDKDLMLFFQRQVLVCTSRNICFKTKHIPGITREISS